MYKVSTLVYRYDTLDLFLRLFLGLSLKANQQSPMWLGDTDRKQLAQNTLIQQQDRKVHEGHRSVFTSLLSSPSIFVSLSD